MNDYGKTDGDPVSLYQDPVRTPAERAEALLSRMTLEEKIGQLVQVGGGSDKIESVRAMVADGQVGSRILASNWLAGCLKQDVVPIEENNRIQRLALATRLGIPVLNGRDVIHGHRTVFPIPLAQAASWNLELVERAAGVAALEARSEGVHWTFSPMVDISSDPRWGRVIEGAGEDPLLAGAMGAAMVRGYQGRTPAELCDGTHVLACAKHFVGYGAPEGGRDYQTCEISPTTLRNSYLPPFRDCVDAGVWTVMTGFHDLDGESASGSRRLIQGVLKDEWKFPGFVVSDWSSIDDLITHRLVEDRREACALAFNAGVDMDMCANTYLEYLAGHLGAGISLERLDDAVRRVLKAKFALGLFENPFTDPAQAKKVLLAPAHRTLARTLAGESMVLLQNRKSVLPLAGTARITVCGPFVAERRSLLGAWTLDGLPEETASMAEALREAWPEGQVHVAGTGHDVQGALEQSDVAVVVLGEPWDQTGENASLSDIVLPAGQLEFLRRVARHGLPVVTVICAGRPLAIPEVLAHSEAVLWAWHGGTETAGAVAELLSGSRNPSGRLPVTLPRCTGQIPIRYNHKGGAKNWPGSSSYADGPTTPLFPFGFGLSYTEFAVRDQRLSADCIALGETVTVSAEIINEGLRPGVCVVQCYVQDCVASIKRPVRELKGFQRMELAPGERQRISFKLSERQLGFYGLDSSWRVERGRFLVGIGLDSRVPLDGAFSVT